MTKIFSKNKFHFLRDNGTIKEPKCGDVYAIYEWRFTSPFKKVIIIYKLINDSWIEQK